MDERKWLTGSPKSSRLDGIDGRGLGEPVFTIEAFRMAKDGDARHHGRSRPLRRGSYCEYSFPAIEFGGPRDSKVYCRLDSEDRRDYRAGMVLRIEEGVVFTDDIAFDAVTG